MTHTANEKCLLIALAGALMGSALKKKRGKRAQHREFLVIAMTEAGRVWHPPWNTLLRPNTKLVQDPRTSHSPNPPLHICRRGTTENLRRVCAIASLGCILIL